MDKIDMEIKHIMNCNICNVGNSPPKMTLIMYRAECDMGFKEATARAVDAFDKKGWPVAETFRRIAQNE